MDLVADLAAHRHEQHRRMLKPLAVGVFAYVVAYAISLLQIETVMGSGPVLAGLGIWLTIAASRAEQGAGVLLGAGFVVLALTLFVTVNVLSWSPGEAEEPFAIIGAVVGGLVVLLALLALRSPRSGQNVELREALSHEP